MPRVAVKVELNDAQRRELESIANSQKAEYRLVRRARIILRLAEGKRVKDAAAELEAKPNTVIKWRDRYLAAGIEGLKDAKRSGKPRVYGDEFRNAVLAKIGEKPPDGLARWDCPTLARELGASKNAVWRCLSKEGIHLERQRTWRVSAGPEFAEKAADIVGLYLDPPKNAVVFCIDEKPGIQALSRKTGYVYGRNGEVLRAVKSTYRRNGTSSLFAALERATGKIHAKPSKTKTRKDFLLFMDELLGEWPEQEGREFHVILDNYCTHKRNGAWLEAHTNVFFHYTPTYASWLNMVEIWFNILTRKVLKGASFDSTQLLNEAIDKFVKAYNEDCKPFVWRKREVKGAQIRDTIANLAN